MRALNARRTRSGSTRNRGGDDNADSSWGAIRDHVAAYLAGTESLDDLKDWLVGSTWNLDEASSPEASALAYEVKLALADESSGITTHAELDDTLAALVAPDPAAVSQR